MVELEKDEENNHHAASHLEDTSCAPYFVVLVLELQAVSLQLNSRNAYVALGSELSKIVVKGHFDQQFLGMFAISVPCMRIEVWL